MELSSTFFNISDFELTQTNLSEGDYATVYVVNNNKSNKKYIAKIINHQGTFNGHDQMQLINKSSILQKFNHPSLIKFYGINFQSLLDQSKFEPAIISEYMQNGSLKDIFDKKTDFNFTSTKKSIFLLAISDSMRYLHQKGIFSLNLNPENILIDSNQNPKISDYGLIQCFPKLLSQIISKSEKSIEKVIYMAPELFEDKENYGPKSDVYSFSILAYQILTGKKPFLKKKKEISIESLIKDITSGVRPKSKKIKNSNLRKLISLCWSQNPEERPTFSEIFEKLRSMNYFDEDVNEVEINEFLATLKINQEEIDEEENEFSDLNDKQIIEIQKKENQSYFNIIKNLR